MTSIATEELFSAQPLLRADYLYLIYGLFFVCLLAKLLAMGQPKRSVGYPVEAALFAAGVYLSNLF